MINHKFRSFLVSLLILSSFSLLIWTQWPVKHKSRLIIFQPGELQVHHKFSSIEKYSITGLEIPLAFLDTKKILLEWTPVIRKGDYSQVYLSLISDKPSFNDNISGFDENPKILASFENVFNEYTINAEARIDFPGLNVKPAGVSGQVFQEEKDIIFKWKISSERDGLFEGTTWLYLQYFPRNGGEFIEQAISAQTFDINVVSFLGINSNYWRVVGVLGIIIGMYIQKKHIIGLFSKSFPLILHKSNWNPKKIL